MKKCIILVVALFFGLQGWSQSRSTLEDEGYDYLNNAEFAKAYAVFDKLHSRYPKEIDYHFKLGICALNYTEKKERAIEIFQEMKVKYNTPETEMYLGKAYHRNYKFDEAIVILQPLLEKLNVSKKKEDKDLIPEVQLTLNNSLNGKELIKERVFADIQNIGAPVNTSELEGVPVITADESMMIYTYVGRKSLGGKVNAELKSDSKGVYTSDIYITTKDATGVWQPGIPVETLNTRGNDAAIALSPDGSQLFTFLSNNENEGDIMISRLTGTVFGTPEPLNSNINNPDYWEGSCSISADGKHLFFSSERPTGLGGRDIYVSEWVNGDWGPAVNLGPNINTQYDDDAPFIHPDGVTLFFSSKGHMSIGGYDIMYSTKDENGEWGPPKSMGVPLNTPEDDSYYVINSKGDRGYFSSTRTGSGGFGSQDIYVVTPGMIGQKPILAMIKGTIFGDDKPVEGRVDIRLSNDQPVATYSSNATSGKYLATLRPGESYIIKVSAEGYESQQEEMDLTSLDTYLEQNKDFYLYSQSFAGTQKSSEPLAGDPKQKEENDEETVAQTNVPADTRPEEPVKEETEKERIAREAAEKQKEAERRAAEMKEIWLAAQKAKEENQQEEEPEQPVTAAETKKEEKRKEAERKAEEKKQQLLAAAEAKKEAQRKAAERAAQLAEEKQEYAAASVPVRKKRNEKQPVMARLNEPAGPCNSNVPDLTAIKGRSLNDPAVYQQFLDLAGNYCADRLVFTVQVGAFKHPENFKTARIASLGSIDSKPYPDGVTRFTQNEYNTLYKAERQRQKAIARGIKDAWIVAFIDGQRYTLEDFIMLDFMGRAIN